MQIRSRSFDPGVRSRWGSSLWKSFAGRVKIDQSRGSMQGAEMRVGWERENDRGEVSRGTELTMKN